MIFSKQILKDFIPFEQISTDTIYQKLNSIGLEVDFFQHIQAPNGVVIGNVLEVTPHPNANKLKICRVDIGNSVLQIVCGAANVAQGQFVPVATIGTRINEQLTIAKSQLRGEMSEGMICSAAELGFPKTNDGILVLDASIGNLKIGTPLSSYPLFNDDVFKIDITPNRGDCLSLYGIARDLAAGLNLPLQELKKDAVMEDQLLGIGRLLQIDIQQSLHASLLYTIIQSKDITLSLPITLALAYNELLDPNPLVSLIRYATLVTGTIFNLYPYDSCSTLQDQNCPKTLIEIKTDGSGTESVYSGNELLSHIGIWYNTDKIQTDGSGVWIIEASYIPPENILKQVAKIDNLKKDQALYYRTSRGSNPHLSDSNKFLTALLHSLNINIYSGNYEVLQNYPQRTITTNTQQINGLIGGEISTTQIIYILKKLGFEIDITSDENRLILTPPLFRHDIHNKQDIAEEIVRIINIDSIPAKPLTYKEQKRVNCYYEHFLFERNLAKKAINAGFSETIHFIFTQKSRLKHLNLPIICDSQALTNPITEVLDTLRPTLLLSLLDSMALNLKNGKKKIAFFEIGIIFDSNRKEHSSLAFVSSHIAQEAIYPHPKDKEMNLFEFAEKIAQVIGDFTLDSTQVPEHPLAHPAQVASIMQNNQAIGFLAKLHPALHDLFDVSDTFIAEIDLNLLKAPLQRFEPFSKIQKSQKDLTVLIDKNIPFKQIRTAITALNIAQIKELYPLDIYQDDHIKPSLISLTIRFILQDPQSNMEEKDMNHIMQQILQTLSIQFRATLR